MHRQTELGRSVREEAAPHRSPGIVEVIAYAATSGTFEPVNELKGREHGETENESTV
jgi:hypothetical protein